MNEVNMIKVKIKRSILFFYQDQVIDKKKIEQYFTEEAVGKLIKDGYISFLYENIKKDNI